jgi:hypothetical protein
MIAPRRLECRALKCCLYARFGRAVMHVSSPHPPRTARHREQLSNSLAVLALLAGGIVWAPDGTVPTDPALERPAHGSPREAGAADRAAVNRMPCGAARIMPATRRSSGAASSGGAAPQATV